MPGITWTDLEPGRYRVKIEFELDGVVEDHYWDCHNPAYGARMLEEYRMHLVKSRYPSVERDA